MKKIAILILLALTASTALAQTPQQLMLKGNEDLLKIINEALNKAAEDGTLSAISMKYFDVDTTKG